MPNHPAIPVKQNKGHGLRNRRGEQLVKFLSKNGRVFQMYDKYWGEIRGIMSSERETRKMAQFVVYLRFCRVNLDTSHLKEVDFEMLYNKSRS